jgi:hypothetical protein
MVVIRLADFCVFIFAPSTLTAISKQGPDVQAGTIQKQKKTKKA